VGRHEILEAVASRAVERRVTLTAPALDLLLFDWLSELIYLKERGISLRAPSGTSRARQCTCA
jgi:hypothetical protein